MNDRTDCENEQHHEYDRDHDDLHRLHARALVVGLAPDADGAGKHRLDGIHHDLPPRPATSKNVYDRAIELMLPGSLGSTTKVTGSRRVSPAARVCCEKQKHSIFLKYSPAFCGP